MIPPQQFLGALDARQGSLFSKKFDHVPEAGAFGPPRNRHAQRMKDGAVLDAFILGERFTKTLNTRKVKGIERRQRRQRRVQQNYG